MRLLSVTIFLCMIATFLFSCRRDRIDDSPSLTLTFSNDTIFFDTVFTSIGSTTFYLRAYNSSNGIANISRVYLNDGGNSKFRFNIDGLNGPSQQNIEILPNDSVFIFVEVTVDPNDAMTPFICEDELVFETNGNQQEVKLLAYGQNAHFHGGLNSCNLPVSEVISSDEQWNNDLPHVIYGIVMIDSGATLNINNGVQVYCHGKSGLWVNGGTLKVNGLQGSEVVFQGDRLESDYSEIPGQWGIQLDCPISTSIGPSVASIIRGGIWIFAGKDNEINYAILKNGNIGIQVDTTSANFDGGNYALKIQNTKILNMAGYGILGQGSNVRGVNLLVANCGQACGYFGLGGRYHFDNCTFANYWQEKNRTVPCFVLNNYYEDVYQRIQTRPLYDAQFNNCIMYGNNAGLADFSEFILDLNDLAPTQYTFRSCLVDAGINVSDDNNHFYGMTNQQAPPFCSIDDLNFQLSSNSQIVAGSFTNTNPNSSDIRGVPWFSEMYKGCYAFDASSPCSE